MSLRLFIAILVTAIAPGCANRSAFVAPVPELPDAYATALPEEGLPGNTAVIAEWWQLFKDPQLTQLVERALEANYDVRQAVARIREVRALRNIADARAQPQIGVAGSATRDRLSPNGRLPLIGVTNPANVFQAGFESSWEIDAFGGIGYARETAAAELARSELESAAVTVSVGAEVVGAYVRLRGIQSQLAILDKQLLVARDAIAIAKARVGAGLSSELDVLTARELADTLGARRPQLHAEANQTLHRLGVLMGGKSASLVSELSAPRPLPKIVQQLPPSVPAQLLARRPDLRAIERTLAAENARVGSANAARYPSLSAGLALGLVSLGVGNLTSFSSVAWSGVTKIAASIYDGGARDAAVDAAQARYEQAAIRYEGATTLAVSEVETAALRYAGSRERSAKLAAVLHSSEDALKLALVRYRGGLTGFTDVIDAQRQVFRVRSDEVATREESLGHLIALYKALGGGWNVSAR